MSFFSFLFGRGAKTAPEHASPEQQLQERRGKRPPKPTGVTEWAPIPTAASRSSSPTAGKALTAEAERAERRDLLYRVVRETLMRCGVLSASYKFKVLSTDVRGRQFLVMLDVAAESASLPRFAEIEALVVRLAKQQHDIEVSATYWRVNAQLSPAAAEMGPARREELASRRAPLTRSGPVPLTGGTDSRSQRLDERPTEPASLSGMARLGTRKGGAGAAPGRFEPIDADEVDAFKKALASASGSGASADGVLRRSSARVKPPVDFEDTQVVVNEGKRPAGLSLTQYGGLE